MSPPRIPLASVTDRTKNFTVVVKLEALLASRKSYRGDQTLQNLLFTDREGTEMPGVIFQEDIGDFKDILHEGHEYEIKNPFVKIIPEQFKFGNQNYQMQLKGDLLGIAIYVRSLRQAASTVTGNEYEARDIIIVDQVMRPVVVTAWRNLALEPVEKVARAIESLPVIHITRVKASRYRGGSWGTTKFSALRLNSTDAAAEDLRIWATNNIEAIQHVRHNFPANVFGESLSEPSASDESLETLVPISSLANQEANRTILVKGKITSITNPDNFIYNSCNTCRNSTTVESDSSEIQRRPVEVNIKIMLNDILKQLNLSTAEFGIHAVTEDEQKAYVQIKVLGAPSEMLKIIGSPSKLLGPSQQNCARKAIKFLQDLYKFDVLDFNYYDLQLIKHNYNTLRTEYYMVTGEALAPELELLSISADE
ncbi:replication protein A 70 kDa DNA-binding subunit B-like [Silene latifolia]|uniref:replication protein A 70 kDa DNA-binding subunit B-like n=1 Tax=Silene latifolia TaxID=37657 RepID=UPI003D779481